MRHNKRERKASEWLKRPPELSPEASTTVSYELGKLLQIVSALPGFGQMTVFTLNGKTTKHVLPFGLGLAPPSAKEALFESMVIGGSAEFRMSVTGARLVFAVGLSRFRWDGYTESQVEGLTKMVPDEIAVGFPVAGSISRLCLA